MQSIVVMIDETPHCVWDWELERLESDFLAGIDPEYFTYMAKAHDANLDGDGALHAALALRLTYSHAMETLMSLICAVVQSPQCAIGWLHKYRNDELDSVVSKLVRGMPVPTKLVRPDLSWAGLSKLIHKYVVIEDKVKEQRIQVEFGRFWSRIATDFLDDGVRREYNSIKHGLRAQSGGHTLAVGIEATPGVAAAPEGMGVVGGSVFGSTYYVPTQIDGADKGNIKITETSRNWLPDVLAIRTFVLSMSMTNILAFLKIINGGDPEKQTFVWPQDMAMFDDCWNLSPGVIHSSINVELTAKDIKPISRAEMTTRYNAAGNRDTA